MVHRTTPSPSVLAKCVCLHERPVNKLMYFQVFALFVGVPPFIQTTQLLVKAWYWFRGLSLVRRMAGPPPERPKEGKRRSYFELPGY